MRDMLQIRDRVEHNAWRSMKKWPGVGTLNRETCVRRFGTVIRIQCITTIGYAWVRRVILCCIPCSLPESQLYRANQRYHNQGQYNLFGFHFTSICFCNSITTFTTLQNNQLSNTLCMSNLTGSHDLTNPLKQQLRHRFVEWTWNYLNQLSVMAGNISHHWHPKRYWFIISMAQKDNGCGNY